MTIHVYSVMLIVLGFYQKITGGEKQISLNQFYTDVVSGVFKSCVLCFFCFLLKEAADQQLRQSGSSRKVKK